MESFGYVAVNKAGKEVKGSIEADNEAKALAEIKNRGMMVVSLTKQGVLTKDINIDIGGAPKPRDLSVFCRQFVSMTRAGVTIIDALRMLGEQTENKKLQQATVAVRVDVEKGEPLAEAFAKHPKIFPNLLVSMTQAGEASGSLDVAMERMAAHFEKAAKTSALIKKAMIYPVVLIIVAIAVMVVMLIVVIPSYMGMFTELGTELPAVTKLMVSASNFLQENWYFVAAAVIAVVVSLKMYAKTNSGKHVFGKLALLIPAMKNLKQKEASSMMSRTLSTLMAAGVPLTEAVGIVSNTMQNIWYKEALLDVKDQITLGVPLSQPLETCGLFPPMVYHMTRIGEESGNTEEMLDKIADYYDEEVEMAVQSLMAAMEPMIIIVMALIVGVMVYAVMSPMMDLYNSIG
ncbi:MAG: type II secretion system F family protein [Lachnospiraceae bacterium]|nr:type II secretion system F family protein [Lachnospiraceae bacterium]